MKPLTRIQAAAIALSLALAPLGHAANVTLAELFSGQAVVDGKPVPLTLRLTDLNEGWRRFSTSAAADAGAAVLALYARSGASSSFYTRGQTVAVGGESYLIAYRLQMKAPNLIALQQAMMRAGGTPPEPERPTPQTALALALLNVRTAGSFTDVQPFNLDFELTGSDSALATDEDKHLQEITQASLANLRKLGTALILYERERKVLPVLTDANAAQQDLALYVADKNVFIQPDSKSPYQPNPALSGKRLADVAKPEKTVAFYEARPAADSTRGVLFLDGHVERLPETLWPRLKPGAGSP